MAGGTCFIVEKESTTFLVSNTHVVRSDSNCTIRINSKSGEPQFHNTNGFDWTPHPNGDDVAVAIVDKKGDWDVEPIIWDDVAATGERMEELNIGVGDEIFMIGRFAMNNKIVYNQPLARFGNISMMPGEPIRDKRGLLVEAYLGEMRSLSGFSGSPVFVYLGPGTYRGNKKMMPFYSETIGLIGIDTGHLEIKKTIQDSNIVTLQNTGVSMISPISKIEETIIKAIEEK